MLKEHLRVKRAMQMGRALASLSSQQRFRRLAWQIFKGLLAGIAFGLLFKYLNLM